MNSFSEIEGVFYSGLELSGNSGWFVCSWFACKIIGWNCGEWKVVFLISTWKREMS
jgi:hypothetical protein